MAANISSKTPGVGSAQGDGWAAVDPSIGDPLVSFQALTKSDATVLPITRALYVGTGGDVAIMGAGNTTAVTLKNVPSGTFLWVRVSQFMSTNTTASDVVGCW